MNQARIREIVICMGSSCFSRGNKQLLGVIQQYLKSHGLYDAVTFRGSHCFGACENGPVLMINGNTHTRVSSADIIDILESYLV